MQTTLLGLAIAFIIALLAALIGPYFIDWNQFRPQFEAEASRILGTPVRVGGALDARLLPVPSLALRDVQVGGGAEFGKIRAARLDVELNLGSLMRGEVRASELTINGAALDLGLDANGRIDWPAATGGYDLGSLAIDRVNLTGRIALHDATSRGTIELDDIAFSGDVRALAGSIRGDGNFKLKGARYPFRVSSTPGVGNVGTRVHLTVDPAETALAIDLDGLLTFDNRSPRFDGALLLARPAPPKGTNDPAAPPPWRIAAKLKADPVNATLEQIEATYGADETSLKVAGTAGLRFGGTPQGQATLTAKSIDADRLRGTDAAPRRLASELREMLGTVPELPFPVRVTLAVDQIMLGGKPVQNVLADLRGDASTWRIDKLDVRAPGATSITLAGAALQAAAASFNGTLTLDSAEPDLFAAWLQGRSDGAPRVQKPLRLRGNLAVAPDRVTLESMSGEIDGSAIDGRLAMLSPTNAPSRAELRIKADRLDLDSVTAMLRSLAGPDAAWPDEAQLSLDIGRAVSARQEMRPFGIDLRYGAQTIALERLRVGEANGVMLDGTGAFDRASGTGQFALSASALSLAQAGILVAPFAPALATRLIALPPASGNVRLKAAVDVFRNATQADRAGLLTTLTLEGPQLAGTMNITAAPRLAAIQDFNLGVLNVSDIALTTKLSSLQGRNLVALLGLDTIFAADAGAAQLDATLSGTWNAPLRLTAKLSGAAIDGDIQGMTEPFADVRKASLSLALRRANIAPLLALKAGDPRGQIVNLTSKLAIAGDKVSFDGLDGTIAGTRLRGKLAVTSAEPKVIDGEFGLDSLELAPVFNLAIGNAGVNPADPLGAGVVQGWQGRLLFQALRGGLPGGLELRPFSGTLKSDGRALIFDAIKGGIGGGEVAADIDARPGLSGLALNARLTTTNVESGALRYRTLVMPGRTSMTMTLSSQGRSAGALAGALSGDGLLTLENAKIPGFDPRAFDLVLRASDEGRISDDARLTQVMQTALNAAPLSVPSAQIGVAIKDGNLRVAAITLEGDGARALVSGGYDIAADQADIRATLTSTLVGSGTSRPEVRLLAVGPPDRLSRSLDTSSFSTWLAVRAIDRETRRLDQLERETTPSLSTASPPLPGSPADRPATALPSVTAIPAVPNPALSKPRVVAPRPIPPSIPAPNANVQVAPLPPAIDVRPAPGGSTFRPPRPRGPLVLTPPAAVTSPRTF